jgi:hypothetical protein
VRFASRPHRSTLMPGAVRFRPRVRRRSSCHRKRIDSERAELERVGLLWQQPHVIFPNELGGYMNPDNLGRHWRALRDKAGVPAVRLHDLRHLHASIAIRSGMDPKVLADRLGHPRELHPGRLHAPVRGAARAGRREYSEPLKGSRRFRLGRIEQTDSMTKPLTWRGSSETSGACHRRPEACYTVDGVVSLAGVAGTPSVSAGSRCPVKCERESPQSMARWIAFMSSGIAVAFK